MIQIFKSDKSNYTVWASINEKHKKVIILKSKLNLADLIDLNKLCDLIISFNLGKENFGLIELYIDDSNLDNYIKLINSQNEK